MKQFPEWPAWRHGPNGEAQIFDCEEDVPKGWQDRSFPGFPKAMGARGPIKSVLDHDGDGKPGGSKSAAEDAKDAVKALRVAYQEKFGKKPFSGWGAEELQRRMDAA
jgi:hypothetical protein